MKHSKTFLFLLAFIGSIIIVGLLAYYNSSKNSTSNVYQLSSNRRNHLEKLASEGDADAAYRIALYYERSNKNYAFYLLWLQRASDLGNLTARRHMDELKNSSAAVAAETEAWIAKAKASENRPSETH